MDARTSRTDRSPDARVVPAFTVACLILASGFMGGAFVSVDPVVGALCVGAAFALVCCSLLLIGLAKGLSTYATRTAERR